MGFLRFIIIFLVVSYLLSLLLRFMFKRYIKKVQKNFNERTQEYNNMNKNEGDISVDYSPESEQRTNNNDGEYVDFEEIDE